MTVEGLRAALDAGVRAIISTPRAQNPTGVSLSPARAAALRNLLAQHPYVLVIEDDHFSMLSAQPYESLIGPDHKRFALLRSVSKFLGPDMCLAIAATDPETAERLAMRLSPGTTWVSHLLQRLALGLLDDREVRAAVRAAGAHYAERNAAFAEQLRSHGIETRYVDGMNLWVALPIPAKTVSERLMRRGWLVRTGDGFSLTNAETPSHHLRLTVHDLTPVDAAQLVADIAGAVR
jgi:DNA-binding transcriptional MocR family regulator